MNEQLMISSSSPLRARFYDYKHFTYPWHFHTEYEIIYIKESMGSRFVGNAVDRYSDGDILLLGPNLPHYMKSDDLYHSEECEKRVRGTIIQFEKEFMYYSMSHYPQLIKIKNLLDESQRGLFFPSGCSEKLVRLLEGIPDETGVDQLTSFLQLLNEMSLVKERKIISSTDFIDDPYPGATRQNKIMSFISKNYTRHIELSEIASLASMNPSAFCRFFKNKTGKTLKKYISEMRIAYACKLLLVDDLSISQVGARCGFDTISHFNKTFKDIQGVSPSVYRQTMLLQ